MYIIFQNDLYRAPCTLRAPSVQPFGTLRARSVHPSFLFNACLVHASFTLHTRSVHPPCTLCARSMKISEKIPFELNEQKLFQW